MDPDEALRQIERGFSEIDELRKESLANPDTLEALANAGRVLTEHAEALNEWVGRGGFLPAKWGG
jgi:hypothetical protein